MESILKALQESPYTWAILSLVAIGSLIIAIYSWVKGTRFKRLTYTKKTNKLISLKNVAVDSLHLFFNQEEIMDVSITRIAVWNSGNERIDSADFVASRLLRAGLREGHKKDSRILNCAIDYETDETIFGDINPNEIEFVSDTYTIPIDYLAPSDGMIIQIVHTGDNADLYMDCHIKGGKAFYEVDNFGWLRKQNKIIKNDNFSIKLICDGLYYAFLATIGLTIGYWASYWVNPSEEISRYSIIIPLLLLLFFIVLSLLINVFRISIPKKLNDKL